LWGKACYYLDESINRDPTFEVYAELGGLMAEQNQFKDAVSFYEKAAGLITS